MAIFADEHGEFGDSTHIETTKTWFHGVIYFFLKAICLVFDRQAYGDIWDILET